MSEQRFSQQWAALVASDPVRRERLSQPPTVKPGERIGKEEFRRKYLDRCHCGRSATRQRDPDPWEGRLDGYCDDCALARCDAFPASCPKRDTEG